MMACDVKNHDFVIHDILPMLHMDSFMFSTELYNTCISIIGIVVSMTGSVG